MIPRRIIHVWVGKPDEPLSLLHQAALANCRLLHPDWEHVLFDMPSMIDFIGQHHYGHLFENGPVKIRDFDLFRLLAVYQLGGFYFDMDVLLAHSLELLCDSRAVFTFEEPTINPELRRYGLNFEIANYGFGAEAGHPFIGALIEEWLSSTRGTAADHMLSAIPRIFRPQFDAPIRTGPGMVSRCWANSPRARHDVRLLRPSGDLWDRRTWCNFGGYGHHLAEGSWRTKFGCVRSKLMRLWIARQRRKWARIDRGAVREFL